MRMVIVTIGNVAPMERRLHMDRPGTGTMYVYFVNLPGPLAFVYLKKQLTCTDTFGAWYVYNTHARRF